MSTLLTSYADLKAEMATQLSRSDLTADIPTAILQGELRIQREVRVPDMESAYSGTIASGVIAVPTGFLEWKHVYIDSNGAKLLETVPMDALLKRYPTRSANGLPKVISRNVGNFEFGPYPDSTYAVKGTYYARPTTVSSLWNALATANPDLYLYAGMAAVEARIQDDGRIGLWEQAYAQTRDALNSEGTRQNISGGAIRMVPR